VQREKIKILLAIPLALILLYLTVKDTLPDTRPAQPGAVRGSAPLPSSAVPTLPAVAPPLPGVPTLATALTSALVPAQLARDPFTFRLLDELQRTLPQSNQPQPGLEGPVSVSDAPPAGHAAEDSVRLKATLIGRRSKLALINDQVVGEGQTVAGYTLTHITPGEVTLTRGSTVLHLRLANGGTP
jgi:hypothetical protein